MERKEDKKEYDRNWQNYIIIHLVWCLTFGGPSVRCVSYRKPSATIWQAFKSPELLPTPPLHESSSFPGKHIYLSFLLIIGDFSALCLYNSSTVACWRKNTRPGVWRPRLKSISSPEKWRNNACCWVIPNLFSKYLEKYALDLGMLVCMCMHMLYIHDEKQCCCSSMKGCVLKTNIKNKNR